MVDGLTRLLWNDTPILFGCSLFEHADRQTIIYYYYKPLGNVNDE